VETAAARKATTAAKRANCRRWSEFSPLSEDDTRPAARDPKVSTSAKIPSFRGTGRRRIRNYNVRDDANNTDEDDEGRL
jgi:hypothetical protein